MCKSKLLSIISVNRNDGYQENLVARTKFVLDYFAYCLKTIGAEDEVEYLMVDWGSEETLASFCEEQLIKCNSLVFVNISKQQTLQYELDFDVSKALNLGINHSTGKHIMLTSPDQFFPLSNFYNLLNLIRNPEKYGVTGDEYKLVPRKFLEDDFFINEPNMDSVNRYFQSIIQSALSFPEYPLNSGAGAGGLLLKRENLVQLGGVPETVGHNSGQDRLLFEKITNLCGHIDTSNFGSFLLKLPRSEYGKRRDKIDQIERNLSKFNYNEENTAVNSINVEIVKGINFANKKELPVQKYNNLRARNKLSKKLNNYLTAIFVCSESRYKYGVKFTSADIRFMILLIDLINKNKFKTVIMDERQAKRFVKFITQSFKDIKIIIYTEQKSLLEMIKFRTSVTESVYFCKQRHHGTIQILNRNDINSTNFLIIGRACLIEDHTAEEKIHLDQNINFLLQFSRTNIEGNAGITYVKNKDEILFDDHMQSDIFLTFTINILLCFTWIFLFYNSCLSWTKNYLKNLLKMILNASK